MRKLLVVLAVVLAVVAALAAPVSAHSRRSPWCGIRWGSLPEHDPDYSSASITDLRVGRHDCFDRLVVDLTASVPGLPGPDAVGYQIAYTTQVHQPGSGNPVAVAGGAALAIIVHAAAHDGDYHPTYAPPDRLHAVDVAGFRTLRQVAFLGTYEGQTAIGVGVRARLPFRVFALDGPGAGSRLVIDVAHRW